MSLFPLQVVSHRGGRALTLLDDVFDIDLAGEGVEDLEFGEEEDSDFVPALPSRGLPSTFTSSIEVLLESIIRILTWHLL